MVDLRPGVAVPRAGPTEVEVRADHYLQQLRPAPAVAPARRGAVRSEAGRTRPGRASFLGPPDDFARDELWTLLGREVTDSVDQPPFVRRRDVLARPLCGRGQHARVRGTVQLQRRCVQLPAQFPAEAATVVAR